MPRTRPRPDGDGSSPDRDETPGLRPRRGSGRATRDATDDRAGRAGGGVADGTDGHASGHGSGRATRGATDDRAGRAGGRDAGRPGAGTKDRVPGDAAARPAGNGSVVASTPAHMPRGGVSKVVRPRGGGDNSGGPGGTGGRRRAGGSGGRGGPGAPDVRAYKSPRPPASRLRSLASLIGGLSLVALFGFILWYWFFRSPAATPGTTGREPLSLTPVARPDPPPDTPRTTLAPRTLTVATFNARDFSIPGSTPEGRILFHDEVAKLVRNAGVDVLLLQEVQEDDEPGGDIALFGFALAKAGHALPYTATLESGTEDDLAVFSAYRILSREAVLPPPEPGIWPRPGLLVQVDVGGVKVDLLNLHLKAQTDASSHGKRVAQARALGEWLRSRYQANDALVVVGGDLNTATPGDRKGTGSPSTLDYLTLKDDGDAANDFYAANETLLPKGYTYDRGSHRTVLDHLLLSPGARAALVGGSVRVLSKDGEVDPRSVSDHYAVVATLAFPR